VLLHALLHTLLRLLLKRVHLVLVPHSFSFSLFNGQSQIAAICMLGSLGTFRSSEAQKSALHPMPHFMPRLLYTWHDLKQSIASRRPVPAKNTSVRTHTPASQKDRQTDAVSPSACVDTDVQYAANATATAERELRGGGGGERVRIQRVARVGTYSTGAAPRR
jgi:hypothetical protein